VERAGGGGGWGTRTRDSYNLEVKRIILPLCLIALAVILTMPQPTRGVPLWSGARFSDLKREGAIDRGLHFIYRTACDPRNFDAWGHDYLWCFYSIGATSQDAILRRLALSMGRERARIWRQEHPSLAAQADVYDIMNLAFGGYAAEALGFPDENMKAQIRRAAARFSATDFLWFNPAIEPPPSDIPKSCAKCASQNPRGTKSCRKCNAPLAMMSPYDIWCDALISTYTGDRYGVTLGAKYTEVIKWLPAMRPYRVVASGDGDEFYSTAYAITHVIYTLNDYSVYRLSPAWLSPEFDFLRRNLQTMVTWKDSETVGELLDTLKSFGLSDGDPVVRAGVDYLLATQNPDGSWGDMRDRDIYNRYHPTWTAIDGLRDYAWRGEALSFPEVATILK